MDPLGLWKDADFSPSEMESHCGVLGREMARFDMRFTRTPLAAVLRLGHEGDELETVL